MTTVLLSSVSPPAELKVRLTDDVDFRSVAVAVIDVGDKSEAAEIQTRRWRSELGDEFVPIVWLLPASDARSATNGLNAGADIILSHPLDKSLLISQLKSGMRSRLAALRVLARANESRMLGEHLHRAHAEIDRERAAVRRMRLAFLQRSFPECGSARFAVCNRARGQVGGDYYDVTPLARDRVLFQIGDVVGSSAAGGLLGHFAARVASMSALRTATQSPGELLAEVNRELLRLGLDDPPTIAMAIGSLDTTSGQFAMARAGLPAPVVVSAIGQAEDWCVAGPFLGTAETDYSTRTATLRLGERLVIGTDGIKPDGDPDPVRWTRLGEIAAGLSHLTGQAYADAVANELLTEVRHQDDFTLMVVEMLRETVHS
jgi:sigma-B regulation protein RsbU (phosphoserine phosphatase)